MRVLLLTPWYFPHKILRWEDAITMVFLDKADVVAEYSEEIRSPSTSMKLPAVIRLRKQIENRKRGVKFSRVNVYTRDGYCCQYCGHSLPAAQLTYDHLHPRSRGGRTEWTNIVTACLPCNAKKGNKRPEEAGMFPLKAPVKPKWLPLTAPRFDPERAPEEWMPYCVT